MARNKKPLFWGYLDSEGRIYVKKYTDDRAIENCERMPYCRGIFDPFTADNLFDARMKIAAFLDQEQIIQKRLQ